MPEELPEAVDKRIVIIDFMGFAHQVPVEKSKLKNFSDLCNHLWTSFQGLADDCVRIDIVSDLYHQKSIKGNDRNRRGKQAGMITDVSHDDQALPVEIDKFWLLSQNKISFQQFFIKWLLMQDASEKTILECVTNLIKIYVF